MPAPDPFASLTPGAAVPTLPPGRNARRHSGHSTWKGWVWPLAGLLGGAMAAVAVRLPLAVLPLVDTVTYAQDNMPRATAVMVCAVVAAVGSLLRWFRLALLCQGIVAGLLLASGLEKWRDYQQLRESTHLPAGAGEMARQSAAMVAQTLAGIHPQIGAFLLPAGCLLGIVAAFAGGWLVARRKGSV